jgi:branched-chain amino acid transport system substrate-binding protein
VLVAYPQVVSAWEKWVNANGGICGHPVHALYTDETNGAAATVATVENWVTAQHVVALAGVTATVTEGSWGPFASAHGVPVTGSAQSLIWQQNPHFFASGPTRAGEVNEGIDAFRAVGAKRIGFLMCNLDVCTSFASELQGPAQQAGLKVVYKGITSLATADWTAYCLAAKSAGAQAVYLAVAGPQTAVDQCARQGYKPHWVLAAQAYENPFTSDGNFQGLIGTVNVAPWFASSPGLNAMRSALAKYGGGVPLLDPTVEVWAGLEMFRKAAILGGANVTPQSVTAGMYKLKGTTLGGLTPPLSFKPGASHVGSCGYLFGVSGGRLSLPLGLKPAC